MEEIWHGSVHTKLSYTAHTHEEKRQDCEIIVKLCSVDHWFKCETLFSASDGVDTSSSMFSTWSIRATHNMEEDHLLDRNRWHFLEVGPALCNCQRVLRQYTKKHNKATSLKVWRWNKEEYSQSGFSLHSPKRDDLGIKAEEKKRWCCLTQTLYVPLGPFSTMQKLKSITGEKRTECCNFSHIS